VGDTVDLESAEDLRGIEKGVEHASSCLKASPKHWRC
jgi:hypothetical protein